MYVEEMCKFMTLCFKRLVSKSDLYEDRLLTFSHWRSICEYVLYILRNIALNKNEFVACSLNIVKHATAMTATSIIHH